MGKSGTKVPDAKRVIPAMIGGVSVVSLDSKGRLAIPAKHRDHLLSEFGPRLVVTLDHPTHLLIYPELNWRPVESRLLSLPTGNPTLKQYQRLVLGHAESLDMDAVGRILIPSRLRQLVRLDKEVALVGMGNRFELWEALQWDQQTTAALAIDPDDLAMHLGDFTL